MVVSIICSTTLRTSSFSAEREIADVALRSRRAANEDSAVGDKSDLAVGCDGEEVASPIPIVEVKCPLVPVSGPSARSRENLAGREQARNQVRAVDPIVSDHGAVVYAAASQLGGEVVRSKIVRRSGR